MWDRLIAQDGIGGEAFIWLIIAFLWVVAQVVSRFKERARERELASQDSEQPDEQKPERAGQSFEGEMRKFLETIGAEPAEEEDAPPEREPRARPRVHRRPAPRREPPPPPVHLVQQPEEAPRAAVSSDDDALGEMDTRIDESALDTVKAYATRESTRSEAINAFVNPRTLLVNLNYLRMNMPLVPITGLDTTSEARARPEVHGRRALRRAITTQLILSNPLAMGEDKASYTKRVV